MVENQVILLIFFSENWEKAGKEKPQIASFIACWLDRSGESRKDALSKPFGIKYSFTSIFSAKIPPCYNIKHESRRKSPSWGSPLVINRPNKYIEILKKICLSTFFDFDFSLIIKILNILGSKSKYLLALVIKNFEVSSSFKIEGRWIGPKQLHCTI